MDKPVFVAREKQLAQLNEYLQKMISGSGEICFVIGEAGSGKTTLVNEFTRLAMASHPDLVVAVGQGDSQTGTGDPYLPFREILAQLAGDADSKLSQETANQENTSRLRKLLGFSGQAIVEMGPDLIGIFIPGAGLLTHAAAFVAEKAGWLDGIEKLIKIAPSLDEAVKSGLQQSYIFEQYTKVLNKLSEKSPLVLVLDDLQWADAASIELLFRIGRRIENHRVLVVGTYRPEEISLGRDGERHPLEKVLAEFKRYRGDILIDLNQAQASEGIRFLEEFLDSESNKLGHDFREAFYHHTHGHPLFTVELLRDMQERGDLILDSEGNWIEGPDLDWSDLPDRVDGVIEGRIGRLTLDLQHSLTIGSVQGEDFTAEVVARVQEADERGLVHKLSNELEKRHRLVHAHHVKRVEGKRLSLYRFHHNLVQKYMYGKLDDIERSYLHEDVGTVLEDYYGEKATEISVQLARHFEKAGLFEKASKYLHLAGDQAAGRFANEEAVNYYSRAINLNLDNNIEDNFDLLIEREKLYDLLGNRESQNQDLVALETIVEGQDDSRKVEVVNRRANYDFIIDDYRAAASAGEQAVKLAEEYNHLAGEAIGYRIWGASLAALGNSTEARKMYDKARKIHRQMDDLQGEAGILNNLGTIADNLDDYPLAQSYYNQSLEIARQVGDRMTECRVLNNLGLLVSNERNFTQAKLYYEEGMNIMKKVGWRLGEGVLIQNIGILHARQGEFAPAIEYFEKARKINEEVGNRMSEARLLENMGCAAADQGEYSKAKSYFDRALVMTRELGNQDTECIVLGNLGSLNVELGDFTLAKTRFDDALKIAREIKASYNEGFMLSSLGDIAAAQGKIDNARELMQQSLEIQRSIGNSTGEEIALHSLGKLSMQCGEIDKARDYFERSLTITKETENRRREGYGIRELGLLSYITGGDDYLEKVTEAINVAKEVNDRKGQAYAVTAQGHMFTVLDRFDESAVAYQKAINIRNDLGQEHLKMESLAGLAQLELKRNKLSQARMNVQRILEFLENNTLDGVDDRFQIFLTCYQVLDAANDPRARNFLSDAYQLLKTQAGKIADDAHRESFMVNRSSNRKLTQIYQSLPS